VIDFDVELVVLPFLDWVDQIVVDRLAVRLAAAAGIRLGIELAQDIGRDAVDAILRNHVAGERLAGRRIVDDPRNLREIATPHRERRHRRQKRLPLRLTVPLVASEEEGLLLENRAAERAAELILLEVGLWPSCAVVEEVVGIERIVTHIKNHGPRVFTRRGGPYIICRLAGATRTVS